MKSVSLLRIGIILRVMVISLCSTVLYQSCAPGIRYVRIPIESGLEIFLDSTGRGCVMCRDAIITTNDFFQDTKDTLSLGGLLFHEAYGNSEESFFSEGTVFCFLYREEADHMRRILSKIDINSGIIRQTQDEICFSNMTEYEDSIVLWGFSDSIAVVNKNLEVIRYYDMESSPGPVVYSNGVLYVALEKGIATIGGGSVGRIDTEDYGCISLISNGEGVWAVCAKEESFYKYIVSSVENNKLGEIRLLDYAVIMEERKAYGNSIVMRYQPLSTMWTLRKYVFYSLDGGNSWKRCREPFWRIERFCVVKDTLYYIPETFPSYR